MQRTNLFRRVLLLTLLGVLAGCGSDQQLTDPSVAFMKGKSTRAEPDGAAGGHGVATCDLQRYAVASQLIGPSGGKLKAGRHEFEIPRGALSSTIRITMEAVADTVHSVRFAPEGLVFNSAHLPRLKLDYKGCTKPKGGKAKIAYVTESLNIISIVRSVDDTLNTDADGQLQHFSRYAVAW